MRKIATLLFLMAFAAGACFLQDSGNFQLFLTDEPVDDAEAIRVHIVEITAHKQGGGQETVSTAQATYDLLQLKDREQIIVDIELSEGEYTEIRLIVDSGEIVIAGVTYEMSVPSSEVKVPVHFAVAAGGATKIVLDFDAKNSIEVVSPGHDGGYILRPIIQVKSVSF